MNQVSLYSGTSYRQQELVGVEDHQDYATILRCREGGERSLRSGFIAWCIPIYNRSVLSIAICHAHGKERGRK